MKDKEYLKKRDRIDAGEACMLDLRGGDVSYVEGNAAAVDFMCSKDVLLNMPWMRMGRGHINIAIGTKMPKNIGLDIRSRSGFTDKGLLCNVAFIGKGDVQVDYMTNVRADVDIRLGLVDSDYCGDIGAFYRVNSDRYMPTKDNHFELKDDYSYYVFVVPKGTRICQGAFREVKNLDFELGTLDNSNDRGGGFGHGGAK